MVRVLAVKNSKKTQFSGAMAVENGRKGGKAKAANAKKRKTLREELLALLETGHWQENITLALLAKAAQGDVRAFETMRDTIGEKPVDKVMIAEVDKAVVDQIEELVKDG